MPIERKLAAIMFTDIAGYTALSAKDSTKASELLKTQRDTLKPIVEKHGGSWMKEIGDGLLLTFDSATSAVECSIAIQVAIKDIEDLNLRIGIHEGEVINQDGDVIGDDVNVASRIEPFSAVGGVAISDKIYRAISSNKEFDTKYIGKPKLKGVSQEVKVYCITSHGLPETDVAKVSAKLEEEEVKPRFNIFALTGGILTTIGIAFWIAVGVFDVSFGGKTEVPSVGILMMDNLGKEDEEFWSSGMTADLITKVAGAGLIRVAPLKDIKNIDSNLSIKEIAKKLRVKYILTHQFLIKDDGFDLWCKLENTENGVALFSNKISEPMSMATQMVGKLANDIVTSLKVKTKQDIMKVPTRIIEAYELYLKAKNIWENRTHYEENNTIRALLIKAIELDDNLIEAQHLLAWTYFIYNEFEKAEMITNKALKKSKDINYELGIGINLRLLGIIYSKHIGHNINIAIDNYNKAMETFAQSLNIFDIIGDKSHKAQILRSIGILNSNLMNTCLRSNDSELAIQYQQLALDYYKQSLIMEKELGNEHGQAIVLNSIGAMYIVKHDYNNALNFFQEALNIFIEFNNNIRKGKSYVNISRCYYYQGQYRKADENNSKALDIFIKLKHKKEIGKCYENQVLINYQLQKYNQTIEICSLFKKGWGNSLGVSIYEYLSNIELFGKSNIEEVEEVLLEYKSNKNEYDISYYLYKIYNKHSYLETAHNQIQEKANNLKPDLKAKFLSYPIPKAIVEEWEKVK